MNRIMLRGALSLSTVALLSGCVSEVEETVSHGSIRMSHDAIAELAREVMKAGGAQKDDSWIASAQRNRSTKQVVDLPNPVPIVVR